VRRLRAGDGVALVVGAMVALTRAGAAAVRPDGSRGVGRRGRRARGGGPAGAAIRAEPVDHGADAGGGLARWLQGPRRGPGTVVDAGLPLRGLRGRRHAALGRFVGWPSRSAAPARRAEGGARGYVRLHTGRRVRARARRGGGGGVRAAGNSSL